MTSSASTAPTTIHSASSGNPTDENSEPARPCTAPPFARVIPTSAPEARGAAPGEDLGPSSELVIMVRVEFEANSGCQHKATIVDSMKLPWNMHVLEFRRTVVQAVGLDTETA